LLIKKFISSLSQQYEVFDIPKTKFGAAGCNKTSKDSFNNPR
jgi:hypothetical protein